MKNRAIKSALAGMVAAAVLLSGVQPNMATAEAKVAASTSKKAASVTPSIKTAKRSAKGLSVTVKVPASKVKKLGKVKKATISYGTSKSGKKFEGYKATAKVAKKGKNAYTFTIKNKKILSAKNVYVKVKLGSKSNWSKLVKVSGKAVTDTKPKTRTLYRITCNTCKKSWEGYNGYEELLEKFDQHSEEALEFE